MEKGSSAVISQAHMHINGRNIKDIIEADFDWWRMAYEVLRRVFNCENFREIFSLSSIFFSKNIIVR